MLISLASKNIQYYYLQYSTFIINCLFSYQPLMIWELGRAGRLQLKGMASAPWNEYGKQLGLSSLTLWHVLLRENRWSRNVCWNLNETLVLKWFVATRRGQHFWRHISRSKASHLCKSFYLSFCFFLLCLSFVDTQTCALCCYFESALEQLQTDTETGRHHAGSLILMLL